MAQQNTVVIPVDPLGGRTKITVIDHAGPASYVTGGETFPQQSTFGGPNSLGLSSVSWIGATGETEDGLYTVTPVTGGKGKNAGTITLKWYNANNATQVAAGTNLSGSTIRLAVIGG